MTLGSDCIITKPAIRMSHFVLTHFALTPFGFINFLTLSARIYPTVFHVRVFGK
jgi:hypothetical protein